VALGDEQRETGRCPKESFDNCVLMVTLQVLVDSKRENLSEALLRDLDSRILNNDEVGICMDVLDRVRACRA
jgi:hypothetical protein